MHISYDYKELNPSPQQWQTKPLPIDYTTKMLQILSIFFIGM
jgi:hypothetical protein